MQESADLDGAISSCINSFSASYVPMLNFYFYML